MSSSNEKEAEQIDRLYIELRELLDTDGPKDDDLIQKKQKQLIELFKLEIVQGGKTGWRYKLFGGSPTYMEINLYNELHRSRDVDDAVHKFLKVETKTHSTMLTFNGLLAGFALTGASALTLDNFYGALYGFCIALAFLGATFGSLLSITAIQCCSGLGGESARTIKHSYCQYGSIFCWTAPCAIFAVTACTAAVNLYLHAVLHDAGPWQCWAPCEDDPKRQCQEVCGNLPALAYTINGISIVLFFLIGNVIWNTLLKTPPHRHLSEARQLFKQKQEKYDPTQNKHTTSRVSPDEPSNMRLDVG